MFVTKRNGTQEAVKFDKITTRIKKLIRPEEENFIDPVVITQKVIATIFSGITTTELDMQSAEICVNLSTLHHYYTNLAGRILVSNLHKTTTSHFVDKMINIQKSLNFLDEKWLNWIKKNKKEINAMIDYDRDYIFDYFGFKTLERAYLIKIKTDVIERPQDVYMRVASFLNQGNLEETKKTYDMLSMGYYTHATPTLFNSGNKRSQLSSCFLLGTDDSLEGITHTWDSVSKISKWGGGIGLHVSNIRAKDSLIKGTNGPSSGIIPMLKVYNEIARYINQGGKRKGSIAIYLEPWHPDILAFLDLRKNFGAETERARDLFLALWIPDLFMKKVQEDGEWYTFCPDECPGLSDSWGEKFEGLYNKYVEEKKFKNKYEARKVMKAILDSQLETGTPYMLFKDTANRKSNQQNIGTIKSSNLCVHEDTLILTNQGYKNIKSLQDKEVEVWNGDEWSKVTVKKTGSNKNLIKVELSNGSYLNCTPEHKFYIQKEYHSNPIEVQAKDLKLNDNLIKFKLPEPIQIKNPEDFKYPYTHGFFCGDGTYSGENKNHPRVCLYGEKKNLINHIEYISYGDQNEKNVINVTLPKDLELKFNVPFNASINNKLRWFEGYCDSDGTIARNDSNESIQITSINKEFLLNIRLMLHTLSIESKVTKNRNERIQKMSDGKGGNKDYNCQATFRLLINSSELYKLSKLGFKPKRLSFIEREPQRDASKFVKVTMVEESYKNVDTYCFTEPLKHMGVFNGIITGQCAEILLYSDDKEYAVCNLASIAVNQFIKVFKPEHKFLFYSKPLCKNSRYIRSFLKFHKFDFEEKVGINEAKQILPELLEQNIRDFPMILYGDKKITSFRELFNFTRNSYDFDKLEEVAYIATKNLDRVIDVNYYPTIETKFSNMKHRPIGIGIQGLADAIVKMKIQVDSDEAVNINGRIMESIYYACLKASNDIAKSRHEKMKKFIAINPIIPDYYNYNLFFQDKEVNQLYHELLPCKFEMKNKFPGTYSTYEGSPFSQGILQFDMWNIKPSMTEKWAELKKEISIYGVRNSQLTALMPTATTSQILGNNECFEFFTNNIYTRRTLAGDFPLVNSHLVDDLNSVQLWSSEMKDLILSYNGSINEINGIPEEIKKLYPTIWEIKQSWILKSAIARGPYVDQTQSMNIFMGVPDYQKLYSSHMFAWTNGLKTAIYYLRTRPAQDAIKFTIDPNIQKQNEKDNIAQQLSDNQTKEKRFKKPEEGEVCDVCSS
jgi:ribonucleoside-diphosphate reductase alpha chain